MGCKNHYMLVILLKRMVLFHLLFHIVILSPGTAGAYILKVPHILDLAIKKMGAPTTFSVTQNLTLHDNPDNPEVFQETINYKLPESFRSDIITEDMSKIYLFSHNNAITIVNKNISSTVEDLNQYYKDPLLFQNPELLKDRLVFLGIDVAISSLGRFKNQFFYVIGAVYPDKTRPQLWIEKESFLPTRFLILDQTDPNRKKIIEFRYLNWTKTENSYYPMRIETDVDDKLLRTIDALSVKLNSDYDDNFFNISHLQTAYPQKAPGSYEQNQTDELKDVQQSIEDLKRRFD
jgi:hypothetical protein